ncbi:hypothetical protein AAIH18_22615, partial [Pantoea agglomerans]|uniref:hypothetical protein n=1 Tax=Enterobacter agglomerans TaxID=549 RepID=UPI003D28ADEF
TTLCFPGNALTSPFTWKPFRSVGSLAYGMFLLHLPVFWAVNRVTEGQLHPLALFVLGGFATWIVAAILHHVITEPLRVRAWKPVQAVIAIVVSFGVVAAAALYLPVLRIEHPRPLGHAAPDESGLFPIDDTVSLSRTQPLTVAVVGDSVAENFSNALQTYRSADLTVAPVVFGG